VVEEAEAEGKERERDRGLGLGVLGLGGAWNGEKKEDERNGIRCGWGHGPRPSACFCGLGPRRVVVLWGNPWLLRSVGIIVGYQTINHI
jgi:hypothetical protein